MRRIQIPPIFGLGDILLGVKNWHMCPFFQNSDRIFEFLGVFSINLQIFVEKDGKKRQGNNFMYFHFYLKNIGNSHLFLILDKVTSSAIHKSAFISRTAKYFDMQFFANIHYF